MDPFSTLNSPHGKVAFQGTVRCDDEGVNEFRVDLPERNPMYGEWRPKFAPNGNDFDVEIPTFGYGSKHNVRNPHPGARVRFTAQEQLAVEQLVRALFADEHRRIGIPPFTSKKARFLGGVSFLPGWVTRSDS
jgi:hypothetical protein